VSMMDLEGLLGGGGQPPMDPGMGADPLAALLGGGEMPMEEPVEEEPLPETEIDILKGMIFLGRGYEDKPGVDESERLVMEKVLTMIQKLLADNERQGGLGGSF
jgi:hypothetical protein